MRGVNQRAAAAAKQHGVPSTEKLMARTRAQVHVAAPRRVSSKKVEAGMPTTEQQKRLAAEYLKDYDFMAAAKRAGYTGDESSVMKTFRRISLYIQEAQLAKAREMGRRVATSQERVLNELAAEAHYSEMDFVIIEYEKRKGEVVTIRRQKRLEELSQIQQRVIQNIQFHADGSATYSLPDRNEARKLIGRHLGMFNDKLIMEHLHKQLAQRVSLVNVPDELLEEIEKKLLKHVGPEGLRVVGEYHPGEDNEYNDAGAPEKTSLPKR